MKRCYEILMTVGIVLVLLLLSFGLLELPKRYFEYSDKRLNGVLSIGGYDIDNGVKSMTRAQIMEVFEKDDVLMIEEKPFVLDRELADRLIAGSLREFLMMFFDKGEEELVYELTNFSSVGEGFYKSAVYNILDVENDEIYSARLGVLSLLDYWNDFCHMTHMAVVFDYDTYDILGVELACESGKFTWDFEWYLDKDFVKNVNEYYGTGITWDESAAAFKWGYISIIPWDNETMDKKVFQTLMSFMDEGDYLYGNLTEMIQE